MKKLLIKYIDTFGNGWGNKNNIGIEAILINTECLFEGFIGNKIDGCITNGHKWCWQSLKQRTPSFL